MSVQVKTPTKTRFDCRPAIQCGERNFSSPESFRRSKDDLSIKNETRFSQPWGRKRRYSQSYRREEGAARRKRLRSSPYTGPLPNRFLNGGSIDDPLNLNGLDSSELGKELNAVTPKSSPLPTPTRRQSVEVRIPLNITDPLNLNDSDEEADLEKILKKKKQRNRHKKKDDQLLFSPPKHLNKDKNLMEALKIDIEPEKPLPDTSVFKEFQKPRPVGDKIVSPVIRQISPKCKKRRRTNSGGKPEPSASVSRSLPTSTVSPTNKDKKNSPKGFKQPKPFNQKNSSFMKSDKTSAKFVYGNYNRYYGYRNPSSMEDRRLDCFRREWFEGKSVLDIGCNVGNMTLALAKDFHPAKIVGIDIDSKLIALARKNIRLFMSSNVTDTGKFPISNVLNYGPIVAPPISGTDSGKPTNFPYNVLFIQGNFVLESDELLSLQKEEHDVILALSVTKWIHFNWGDDGLKRFFKRAYKQLKPGGRFILEPQPWSSYKKKKKLTEEIFKNFKNIQMRPDQFTDYLLSKEIGFSTCNTVDVPYNDSKGFRRPIIVFTKSDTVQNSPWSEVGNVTPIRSTSHTAVFPSHLDHISEDSSCSSCSSMSRQSSFIESESVGEQESVIASQSSHVGKSVGELELDSIEKPDDPRVVTETNLISTDRTDEFANVEKPDSASMEVKEVSEVDKVTEKMNPVEEDKVQSLRVGNAKSDSVKKDNAKSVDVEKMDVVNVGGKNDLSVGKKPATDSSVEGEPAITGDGECGAVVRAGESEEMQSNDSVQVGKDCLSIDSATTETLEEVPSAKSEVKTPEVTDSVDGKAKDMDMV